MIQSARMQSAAAAVAAVAFLTAAPPSGAGVLSSLKTIPANWIGGTETPVVVPADVPGARMPTPTIWACATAPCEPNASGNNHAVFLTTIDLSVDPDASIVGRFKILADDMFIFSVNGRPAFAGMLRIDPITLDPIPFEFFLTSPGEQSEVRLFHTNASVAPLFPHDDFFLAFVRGRNDIRIDAYDGFFLGESVGSCPSPVMIPMTDGQFWCSSDRVNNWLYLDGQIDAVPEPASLLALGAGLALLGGIRARSRRAAIKG